MSSEYVPEQNSNFKHGILLPQNFNRKSRYSHHIRTRGNGL